jgi:hypothetical protein
MALIGAAGSGKTYTALSVAQHLEGPVAVIDTERGSASKYASVFDFDVLELETFSPQMYVEAIEAAEQAGYKTLIIDSLSHAWTGKEGALEQVSKAARRAQSSNTFGAWRDVTPLHNAMVDAIINARRNILATMRAKTASVQEKDEKTGRTTIRKVGLAPIQRDGLEYEFDVVGDLDQDNNLIVSKTRCPALSGAVYKKAGKEVAAQLTQWLSGGPSNGATANGAAANGAAANGSTPRPAQAGFARSRPAPAAASSTPEDPYADDDVVLCHCGLEAKYVRGKSANGWVCGNYGTEVAACDFKQKDTAATLDGYDPFEDGATENAPAPAEAEAVGA